MFRANFDVFKVFPPYMNAIGSRDFFSIWFLSGFWRIDSRRIGKYPLVAPLLDSGGALAVRLGIFSLFFKSEIRALEPAIRARSNQIL